MDTVRVKDLMIPLYEYAITAEGAGLVEAIRSLKQAERRLGPDRQPPRAVLVVNGKGKVIGQLGHLDFLKSLEPKYSLLGDLETLSRSGVSEKLIDSVIDNLRFWQDDLTDVCQRARLVKVDDIMHPLTESIDEDMSLAEVIHKMVMWQAVRILVTRKAEAVGILRLADVFGIIADCIDRVDRE